MDYRIETKEAFSVYGIEGIFTTENSENLKAIPKFWADAFADGRYQKLMNSTNVEPGTQSNLCLVNAVCDYRETGGNTFPYMLFAFQTDRSDTTDYKIVKVPSAT